jgi:translation initiation factor IF-1
MKDREELKRLARMVLDGSARIADLRRMAKMVLAGDKVVVQASPEHARAAGLELDRG